MPGPLTGLHVLELARILAGPWAGQILADLGAARMRASSSTRKPVNGPGMMTP